MTYHLFTDGSYNPHLHISSIGGYVLKDQKETVFEFSQKLMQEEMLKYHELAALRYGLQKCIEHNITNVICYSDDISLRNLNGLEVLEKPDIAPVKREIIEDIVKLKHQFEVIEFRHIRRKFNKKADKLAERIQLEHFYDNIFFKERFEIESQKLLRINNLVCIEDFYNKTSKEEDIQSFQENVETQFLNSDLYFLLKLDTIDDSNGVANLYVIDKNTQQRTFMAFRDFDIKKVNSYCLDLLESIFKNYHNSPKCRMGLVIQSENLALKKFDMLLRKRFIFPKIKTPLADRFLASCDNFSKICLIDYMPELLTVTNKLKNKI